MPPELESPQESVDALPPGSYYDFHYKVSPSKAYKPVTYPATMNVKSIAEVALEKDRRHAERQRFSHMKSAMRLESRVGGFPSRNDHHVQRDSHESNNKLS